MTVRHEPTAAAMQSTTQRRRARRFFSRSVRQAEEAVASLPLRLAVRVPCLLSNFGGVPVGY
jgi:hypothetical protein